MPNLIDTMDIWRTLDVGSHDFIFVVNPQHKVEYANVSAATAMKRGPEEIIGAPWSELFPGGGQVEHLRKVFESGQVLRVEEEATFPNMTLWLDTRFYPVKGPDGTTVAVLGVSRDITKLKRTERAFKSSQHKLSTVLGNLPGLAYRRQNDADGTFEFVSTGCLALTGYPPEDLVQSRKASYMDLIHPEDRKAVQKQTDESLAARKPFSLTYRMITAKGKQKWVWEQGRGIFSSSRGLRALEGFVMDVTARKRTEDALAEGQRRYRLLFEECPVSLGRWDFSIVKKRLDALKSQGAQDLRTYLDAHPDEVERCAEMVNVLDSNRAALALFEADGKEGLARNLQKLFGSETYDVFREHLIAVADGKTQFSTELTARTMTGRRLWLLLNWAVAPGREETFRDVLICVTDLTELRTAQAEADEHRRQAIRQREASLAVTDRLAAGIAHEINNPLQSIMTQLELLAGEVPPEVRDGKRLNAVMNSIRQIAQITNGLLGLQRSTDSQEPHCSFFEIATDVSNLVSASLQKNNVRVEISSPDSGLTVPLSGRSLSQILMNLILNAGDAMAQGGVVRVEAHREAEELRISVADQGAGISPEDQARVFDPFYTTKGSKGTGLGLSITHSLIKAGGGTIDVESALGIGTVFHIRFPLDSAKT
jgi:two-component system, cell cycle sensor histidine kinase and response regulator CckA